jgi:hypothetical protein
MLRLFQSIFAKESDETGPYPAELVAQAIDRAVDGTDPRLRALPGYRRRLRPAVIRAIDYVVELVRVMPPPAELTRQGYSGDPRVAAVFVSVEHMREVLARDPALSVFRQRSAVSFASRVYALLVMEKYEKKVLGMELHGDLMQREVAQVSVSFAHHRLMDPAIDQDEFRRLLMRRAFDNLLTVALARLTQADELRAGLKRQRQVLGRKLKLLAEGQWTFEPGAPAASLNPAALEARLAAIDQRLHALPPDTETLAAHLDIVVDALSTPSAQIWIAGVPHVVDRMGIKRDHPGAADLAFDLGELRSASGQDVYLLPVSIVPSELPPPVDFIAEAARYLG